MVKIFLSGIGGSGKTTLLEDLLKEDTFLRYEKITEIARNIMRRENITKEKIGGDIEFHMKLQDMIVTDQSKEGFHKSDEKKHYLFVLLEERLRDTDYISDRCVMDCFAVIKMRMTVQDLDSFMVRHKSTIEKSVALYRDSVFIVVYPWSMNKEAEHDDVRLFTTPEEALSFNNCLVEALEEMKIPFIELRETDRRRRVEIIKEIATKDRLP